MAAQKKKTIMLRHEKGALHIGGGRFFYAGEKHVLPTDEADELLDRYPGDLKEAKTDKAQRTVTPGANTDDGAGGEGDGVGSGDGNTGGAGGDNADQTE